MPYEAFLKHPDEYTPGEVILFHEQIQQRIVEVAHEFADTHAREEIVVVGLLRGAYVLVGDFIRALHDTGVTQMKVDFITTKSYGSGTEASNEPEILTDVRLPISDKTVLIVDDIIDTGKTMEFTSTYLKKKGATSVLSFTLLDKPDRRKVNFKPDFVGFTIPDIWVQGYGMDTDEIGRGDKNIIKGPFTYSS